MIMEDESGKHMTWKDRSHLKL